MNGMQFAVLAGVLIALPFPFLFLVQERKRRRELTSARAVTAVAEANAARWKSTVERLMRAPVPFVALPWVYADGHGNEVRISRSRTPDGVVIATSWPADRYPVLASGRALTTAQLDTWAARLQAAAALILQDPTDREAT